MKKWVCPVCGYVYEGENPPAECPVCHVSGDKFTLQAEEKTWAAEHVVGVGKVFGEDVPADGTNPIDSSTPTDDADPAAPGEGDDANIGDNDKPAGEAGSECDSNAATGEAGGDAGANVGASEGNDTGSGGNDVESAVEPSMEASDANESGGAV